MIIAYGSDLHLDHAKLSYPIKNRGAKVLILAGDIIVPIKVRLHEEYFAFFKEMCDKFEYVLYVPGNHEYYGAYMNVMDNFLFHNVGHIPDNLLYLQSKEVLIDDITFAGSTLWTDYFKQSPFSMQRARGFSDHIMIKDFSPEEAVAKHERTKAFFERTKAQVFISHHAPCGGSVNPKWAGHPDNGSFYSSLDKLILEKQPKLWIHGHMHDPVDYMVGKTRIVCNPRGYPMERSPRFQYDFKYVEINA